MDPWQVGVTAHWQKQNGETQPLPCHVGFPCGILWYQATYTISKGLYNSPRYWWWALLGSAVLTQCHSLAFLLGDHHGPSHFLRALPCVGPCRWDCVFDPFWEFQFRAAGPAWPGRWMPDEQIVVFLFRKEWRYRKELFFFPKCKSIIRHVAKKLYCNIRTFGNYSSFI